MTTTRVTRDWLEAIYLRAISQYFKFGRVILLFCLVYFYLKPMLKSPFHTQLFKKKNPETNMLEVISSVDVFEAFRIKILLSYFRVQVRKPLRLIMPYLFVEVICLIKCNTRERQHRRENGIRKSQSVEYRSK